MVEVISFVTITMHKDNIKIILLTLKSLACEGKIILSSLSFACKGKIIIFIPKVDNRKQKYQNIRKKKRKKKKRKKKRVTREKTRSKYAL